VSCEVHAGFCERRGVRLPPATHLTVDKSVSLIGAGASQTTINGGGPVVSVNSGASATLADLTVTGGFNEYSGGGDIYNGGTLTIRNSAVTAGLAAAAGGGIYNAGSLRLDNSMVSGNSAPGGGGIYNAGGGTATLDGSTVTGNGSSDGGGIDNAGGRMALNDSTVSGNNAYEYDGAGIYNEPGGTMTLTNSTVSDNGLRAATSAPAAVASTTRAP
jgi:hypothetical protein